MAAVQEDGRAFISIKRPLHVALHFRSHLAQIELAIDLLQHHACRLLEA